MNTNIRRATVEDAPIISMLNAAVHQLHVAAQPKLYKPHSDQTFPAATIVGFMAKPQYHFYIASEDGVDVGYIFMEVQNLPESSLRYARHWVYIHQISVNPAYQKHGHGQRLIECARQLAHAQNIATIALDSIASNTPAHQFFGSQGFTAQGIRMCLEVGP